MVDLFGPTQWLRVSAPVTARAEIAKYAETSFSRRYLFQYIEECANFWLHLRGDGGLGDYVRIQRLVVPRDRRNEGIGTIIMEGLCLVADGQGWTLTVIPSTDFGGTSVARLRGFYKQFGFALNRRPRRDFLTQADMYRTPRGKEGATSG